MYTKMVIVADDDIDARNWQDVIWAMTYLDFASPVSGLGSKIGFDATNKWPGETNREWGEPIVMASDIKTRVDDIWESLNL